MRRTTEHTSVIEHCPKFEIETSYRQSMSSLKATPNNMLDILYVCVHDFNYICSGCVVEGITTEAVYAYHSVSGSELLYVRALQVCHVK